MNLLLAAILLVNVAVLTLLLLSFVKIKRVFGEFQAFIIKSDADIRGVFGEFQSFITPVDEKTPSGLAQFIQTMSDMIGRSIVALLKTTFMGKASGDARAEQAIDFEIAQAASPLLSMAVKAVPALGKMLKRNPDLTDMVIRKFTNRAQAESVPGNGHSENTEVFKIV